MGREADLFEIARVPLLAFGCNQQVGVADDRLQWVVELVGHARDELPDRGEPLAVNQLVPKLPLLSRVPFNGNEVRDSSGTVCEGDDAAGRKECGFVLAPAHQRATPRIGCRFRGSDRVQLRARLFGKELGGRLRQTSVGPHPSA